LPAFGWFLIAPVGGVLFEARPMNYIHKLPFPLWTQEVYAEYRQTPQWKRTREIALNEAGNMCRICRSMRGLEVHHRSYEHLGTPEEYDDLIVLCDDCHALHHWKKVDPLKAIHVRCDQIVALTEKMVSNGIELDGDTFEFENCLFALVAATSAISNLIKAGRPNV
jgi:hypothetical protein